MATLLITGDKKQLEIIEKQNRLIAKKYGLKFSLRGENQDEVIEKMKGATSLDDLKEFADDSRKKVKQFYQSLVDKFKNPDGSGDE